jgi:hypothetical protein
MGESPADEIRRATTGMREATKSGDLPAWVTGVADWLDGAAYGKPTAAISLKVARAYLAQVESNMSAATAAREDNGNAPH